MFKYAGWALKQKRCFAVKKRPGISGFFLSGKTRAGSKQGRPFFPYGGAEEPKIQRGAGVLLGPSPSQDFGFLSGKMRTGPMPAGSNCAGGR